MTHESTLGADHLPPSIRRMLCWAIGKYEDFDNALAQGRALDARFRAQGRYESEVLAKYPSGFFAEAEDKIRMFRELAPKNGIDADRALAELGLPEAFRDAGRA